MKSVAILLASTVLSASAISAQAETVMIDLKRDAKTLYTFNGDLADGSLNYSATPRPNSISEETGFDEIAVELYPHGGPIGDGSQMYWDVKATVSRVQSFTSYNNGSPTPDTSSVTIGRTISIDEDPIDVSFQVEGAPYSLIIDINQ